MAIEIRNVRTDQYADYVRAIGTGFLEPPGRRQGRRAGPPVWDLDRIWAAFDGDRICGTFRSLATELTVPGGQGCRRGGRRRHGPADHRRQGILTGDGRRGARGDAGSGRGVRAAVLLGVPDLRPLRLRPGRQGGHLDARRARRPGSTASPPASSSSSRPTRRRDEMIGVFEAWRARSAGELRPASFRWDYSLALRGSAWGDAWKGFVAFHRGAAGDVDGYVRYQRRGALGAPPAARTRSPSTTCRR